MSETLILEAVDRVRTAHQKMIAADKAYWQAQHALNDADTERVRARGEENDAALELKAAIVHGIPDDRMASYFESLGIVPESQASP